MQYKIIVDKQPSSNPSDERKEYVIDIEELRVKGDVYDSLNIELERTYVTRRLSLSEYGVLSVLDEPVIEELQEVNIELFEGDNYIYLSDMQGNNFYAEYLIKNDFNDIYATKNEMNSAITQTAESIEFSVNQKLTGYATNEDLDGAVTELNSTISQTAQEINLEVSKKVDDEELTGANITLRINEDISEATINADKININGVISANGNFEVDTSGNMSCNNGTFNGGKVNLIGGTQENSSLNVYKDSEKKNTERFYATHDGFGCYDNSNRHVIAQANSDATLLNISDDQNTYIANTVMGNGFDTAMTLWHTDSNSTQVSSSQITTPKLTQTSLERIKKNISKFTKSATDIINNSDIYEYNLKSDADTDKKLIGFVIGDNYKTPDEVISKEGQGIELYSAIGILWKAVQELSARVEHLEKEVQHE